MKALNKQALRGQSVEGSFYLAECGHCGEMYPSNKLDGGEPLFSGDYGECFCHLCGADDSYIADNGAWGSEAVSAWNYQQKSIEALLDELEAAEKRIAEQQSAIIAPGIMRCAGCGFVLTKNSINMAAGTITAGDSKSEPCPNGCGPLWPVTWKEQALQMRDDSEKWFEELQEANRRIAELEAREVKLPKPISVLHRRDFNDAHRAIYAYPEAEVNAALAAAGIGVKGD